MAKVNTGVLLLRSPTFESQGDPYEELFKKEGYSPASLPVVETYLTNLPALQQLVLAGPVELQIHGVIITSKRSVDAWSNAIRDARSNGSEYIKYEADWSQSPFFAVGESTSNALKDLHNTSSLSNLCPSIITGGSESGTSERLAEYILSYFKNRKGIKLLYLTGDKNRDTLPNLLKNGAIDLITMKVYKTQASLSFKESLRFSLEERSNVLFWWIVFFAPSTADFTLPILREHFQLLGEDDVARKRAYIAAIGPTTEEHLRLKLALDVNVTASKPTAADLVGVITRYDRQSSAGWNFDKPA